MLNYLHRIIDFISILFQGALQENFQTKYCKTTGQTFGDQKGNDLRKKQPKASLVRPLENSTDAGNPDEAANPD